MLRKLLTGGMLAFASVPVSVLGQNTGGVFGPVVNEGHRSWQYRIAYDHDAHADAQRLHYQHAVNDDLMWRLVVQRREMADGDHEHDFVQGELFWQLPDVRNNWQQGVRFDLRASDGDRPHVFGMNWMNDLHLGERWMARFLVLTSMLFGENRDSGVILQTRASLNYRASANLNLALSMFNVYGFVDDMPDFEEQRHQIGPTLTANLGRGWAVRAGYLAGVNRSTPDDTFRLWLTKSL
mgnify:FL=1